MALLPIPVLIKLEVKLSKKLGLIGLFTLGLFTTFCSIMRYTTIDRIQHGDGNSTMLVLWGTIEFNVGVCPPLVRTTEKQLTSQNMVSSLPFLAPIFIRKAREYKTKHSDGYDNTPTGQSRSRGGLGVKSHYRLKDMSHGKDMGFTTLASKGQDGSEENILRDNGGIMKSVAYTVESEPESSKSVRGAYT